MKFFFTLLSIFFSITTTFATTWNVTVADFSFSPSTINAVIGDVIQFNWSSGFHTTTCGSGLPGTSLPAGASEWDTSMDPGSTTFSYTVTVAGDYFYGCIPHFGGGGGMSGNIRVSGALPVALGTFTAVTINNAVSLNWKTFSESNTDYFSVRKSTDGIKFLEIGRVAAAGNSASPINYRYTDNNIGNRYKYTYYELVTVDIDKNENPSEIKLVKDLRAHDQLIVALSPNPVVRPAQLQVQFNADKNGKMMVNVFDFSGKLVLNETMAAFYGLNNAHLHVCELQKGMYTIRFELENLKEVRKIMVN